MKPLFTFDVPKALYADKKFRAAATNLIEISKIDESWHEDGETPFEIAVRRAGDILIELLRENVAPPLVYPTPEGGIQLEWEHGGRDISVNIDTNGAACMHAMGEKPWGEEAAIYVENATIVDIVTYLKLGTNKD
jgi:hypothetical protein